MPLDLETESTTMTSCATPTYEASCRLVFSPGLLIPSVDDFSITGHGDAIGWGSMPWQPLHALTASVAHATCFKALYSRLGLYFLVDCEDRVLTCQARADFEDLWHEDVVEIFVWPDSSHPIYFQYDVSPLEAELPLVVPHYAGHCGWRPCWYEGERRVRRKTSVRGGRKAPMERVEGWRAEIFIPFALLYGLSGMPPQTGDTWRANVYRSDFDEGHVRWAWCPDTGPDTHAFRQYGHFVFA
jgi:hypothetical protein